MATFTMRSPIAASAKEVFDWHESPQAFKTLVPPGAPIKVLRQMGGIQNGAEIWLLIGPMPLALRWDLIHTDYLPGKQFCDEQVRGPFKSWRHVHRMIPDGERHCLLEDQITFAAPGGWLGRCLVEPFVKRKLRKLFTYRHKVTQALFLRTGHTAVGTVNNPSPTAIFH